MSVQHVFFVQRISSSSHDRVSPKKVLILDLDHTIIDTRSFFRHGNLQKSIYPGVVSFLKDMQSQGYKIAVVTHGIGYNSKRELPARYGLLKKVTRYLSNQGVHLDAKAETYDLFDRHIPLLYSYLEGLPSDHLDKKLLQRMSSMDVVEYTHQAIFKILGKGSGNGLIPFWDQVREDLNIRKSEPVDLLMVGDSRTDADFAYDIQQKYPNIKARAIFYSPPRITSSIRNKTVVNDIPIISNAAIKEWYTKERKAGKVIVNPSKKNYVRNGNFFVLNDWNKKDSLMDYIHNSPSKPKTAFER